ncbi:MAG: hypothetical protein Unbinned2514contig1001_29 [Prokaryotic dsDNA virus sp.]|nr:MAG: hypothetical protein Unbinned2514contig1001_29 [Prokaryotic dsDNA virus sp.]|tara:strand:- start:781 stop:936 length:156 start_codon:yes stop_codon:yes gene_type:complete
MAEKKKATQEKKYNFKISLKDGRFKFKDMMEEAEIKSYESRGHKVAKEEIK